jgi:hypothetical protein
MNAGTDRPSSPASAPPQPSNPAPRVRYTSHCPQDCIAPPIGPPGGVLPGVAPGPPAPLGCRIRRPVPPRIP